MTQGQHVSMWSCGTLMATGYIVPPISKLPFLNIITEVLLMQVPVGARGPLRLAKVKPCCFPNKVKKCSQVVLF